MQVEQQQKYKCICELCSCGRHHCPPPKSKGIFQTSYNNHYRNYPLLKSNDNHPQYQYQHRHYNPQALKTTYQDNYVQPIRPNSESPDNIPAKMVLSHVPFVATTSYKQQFKPFDIQPTSTNPEEIHLANQYPAYKYASPVKFQGISSYKAQFTPPKLQSKLQPYQYTYQRYQVPFSGISSYKNDYPQYQLALQQPTNNSFNYPNKNHVKFQGRSAYNEQFIGYQFQQPQKQHCEMENINIPPINYINNQNHIYYDPSSKKLF